MVNYNCAVPGCKADSRKRHNLSKYPWMRGISFLTFPLKNKKTRLRMKWIRSVRRPDSWRPTRNSRICSLHFMKSKELDAKTDFPTVFPWTLGKWPPDIIDYTPTKSPLHMLSSACSMSVPDGTIAQGVKPVTPVVTDVSPDHSSPCILDNTEREYDDFNAKPAVQPDYADFCLSRNNKCQKSHITEPVIDTTAYIITPPVPDHEYEYCGGHDDVFYQNNIEIQTESETVTCDAQIQTEMSGILFDEMIEAHAKLTAKLEDRASLRRDLFVDHILSTNSSVKSYTGIRSLGGFYDLFRIIMMYTGGMITYWQGQKSTKQHSHRRREKVLSNMNEFLLTLVRFRLGLSLQITADIFGISKTVAAKVFTTWMNLMCQVFQPMIRPPSQKKNRKHMPQSMKQEYPNTRFIIDCTEIFIQKPRSTSAQAATYSTYKSHNTFKLLVAISPSGAFTFVSKLWGGCVSDRHITENSGFLNHLLPGDDVMADRGFNIRDLLLPHRASLNMPPFTRKWKGGNGKRLNLNEIRETRRIAQVRIHVERAIRRLKTFKMLSNILPLTLKPLANQMVIVGCFLSNLLPPLLKK